VSPRGRRLTCCQYLPPCPLSNSEKETLLLEWNLLAPVVTTSFANGLAAWTRSGTTLADVLEVVLTGTFPNATLPGFPAFAADLLKLSSARAISFNPLITQQQLTSWTAYALPLAPSFGPGVNTALGGVYERNASNVVVPTNRSRAFTVPVWQISPWSGNAAAVFYDLHSQIDRQRALDAVLASGTPAVTDIIQLVQDTAANVSRASGIVFGPVLDGANVSKVVGFTSVVFSWDSFIGASLPSYANDLDVVLASASGRVWTFQIKAGAVHVLGQGNLHAATAWDYIAVATNLTMGASFTVTVLPTQALISRFVSDLPVTIAASVVAIIVGITLVFGIYDYLQRHRTQLLARMAMVAGRIVREVFPDNVRDRLYAHTAQRLQEPPRGKEDDPELSVSWRESPDPEPPTPRGPAAPGRVSDASATHTSRFSLDGGVRHIMQRLLSWPSAVMQSRTSSWSQAVAAQEEEALKSPPIADHFDDCTVLFADIVQFTAWAATKSPERVFKVLEAIFREFDASARRHDVFKVETIGDCYMACTGVPNPSATHANRMADFALSLIPRIARACESCGMDSDALQVRVGMHSGSVTAGVLRNDKSRFQLFGDTVNSASRMESTGEAGRVQCSADTAALLTAAKSHILERRGMVEAKGKGSIEAHWVLDSMKKRSSLLQRNSVSDDQPPASNNNGE
jgi:class 3 adenylate cyclase